MHLVFSQYKPVEDSKRLRRFFSLRRSKVEEEKKEIADEVDQQNFVKMEVNFLQYPIGTLDRRSTLKKITYKDTIPMPGGKVEIEWQVIGSAEYGIPGPTAIELDDAITEMLMQKERWINGRPPKWMATTYYELIKMMGMTPTGGVRKMIKRDIERIRTTTNISKGAYKKRNRDGVKSWFDGQVNKYQFLGQLGGNPDNSIPDAIAQTERETTVIIGLTDIYWENIAGIAGKPYTMPINFTFMKTLENSVLKRVYKLLALAFQTMARTEYKGEECINYNYQELCGRTPIKTWEERYKAKGHIQRYLDPFVKEGILRDYELEFNKEDRTRWFVRLYQGPRSKEDEQRILGQQDLFERIEPKLLEAEQQKRISAFRNANKKNKKIEEQEQAALEAEARQKSDELTRYYDGLNDEGKQAIDEVVRAKIEMLPPLVRNSKLSADVARADAIEEHRMRQDANR